MSERLDGRDVFTPLAANTADAQGADVGCRCESETHYRETFERAPVGIAHLGVDGRWLRFNRRFADLVGYSVEELKRLGYRDITYPPDLPQVVTQTERLLAGEVDACEMEKRYVRKDGAIVWTMLHLSLVRAPDGAPLYLIGVVEDIGARKAAEAALEEARLAAEAGSRAKSRFLATMSHEVRTPLAAMMGYADLLELGVAGPLDDRQREYLQRVRRSGEHLLTVVNQVLDLAKIEADRLTVQCVEALVGDTVDGALASVEPQAAARGLQLLNACGPAGAHRFVGDPDRTRQILVNILGNAVKFTPPGGRVTITCGTTRLPPRDAALGADAREWIYVRVEDTGVGIRPERLQAIFEPFEQAESGYTRPHEGSGLGLSISRRLAQLMGGDITVRSQPGVGSAFFLWLPAAATSRRVGSPTERRTGARHAHGLRAVGEAVLDELEHIVATYVARLRADPSTPSARPCTDEQIENHQVTFLADVAHALVLIDAAHGAPSPLIRDGSAIQRIIGERHGAQRAGLGFTPDELRREFAILEEELTAAVRRIVERSPDNDPTEALALLCRFVDHGMHAALRGHRAAADDT